MRTRRNSSNWDFACARCSSRVPVRGGIPSQIIRVGSPAVCISTQVIGLMEPGASRGCGSSMLWVWVLELGRDFETLIFVQRKFISLIHVDRQWSYRTVSRGRSAVPRFLDTDYPLLNRQVGACHSRAWHQLSLRRLLFLYFLVTNVDPFVLFIRCTLFCFVFRKLDGGARGVLSKSTFIYINFYIYSQIIDVCSSLLV